MLVYNRLSRVNQLLNAISSILRDAVSAGDVAAAASGSISLYNYHNDLYKSQRSQHCGGSDGSVTSSTSGTAARAGESALPLLAGEHSDYLGQRLPPAPPAADVKPSPTSQTRQQRNQQQREYQPGTVPSHCPSPPNTNVSNGFDTIPRPGLADKPLLPTAHGRHRTPTGGEGATDAPRGVQSPTVSEHVTTTPAAATTAMLPTQQQQQPPVPTAMSAPRAVTRAAHPGPLTAAFAATGTSCTATSCRPRLLSSAAGPAPAPQPEAPPKQRPQPHPQLQQAPPQQYRRQASPPQAHKSELREQRIVGPPRHQQRSRRHADGTRPSAAGAAADAAPAPSQPAPRTLQDVQRSRQRKALQLCHSLDDLLRWLRSCGGGPWRRAGGGDGGGGDPAGGAALQAPGAPAPGLLWDHAMAVLFLTKLAAVREHMPHVLQAKRDLVQVAAVQWLQERQPDPKHGREGCRLPALAVAPDLATAASLLGRARAAVSGAGGGAGGRGGATSAAGGFSPGRELVVAVAAPHLVGCGGGKVSHDAVLAVVRLAAELAHAGVLPPLSPSLGRAEAGAGSLIGGRERGPEAQPSLDGAVEPLAEAMWEGVVRVLQRARLGGLQGDMLAQHVQAAAWLRLELAVSLAQALYRAHLAAAAAIPSASSSGSRGEPTAVGGGAAAGRGAEGLPVPAGGDARVQWRAWEGDAVGGGVLSAASTESDAMQLQAPPPGAQLVRPAAAGAAAGDAGVSEWSVQMPPWVGDVLRAVHWQTTAKAATRHLGPAALGALARRFEQEEARGEQLRRICVEAAAGGDGRGGGGGGGDGRALTWAEMRAQNMYGNTRAWLAELVARRAARPLRQEAGAAAAEAAAEMHVLARACLALAKRNPSLRDGREMQSLSERLQDDLGSLLLDHIAAADKHRQRTEQVVEGKEQQRRQWPAAAAFEPPSHPPTSPLPLDALLELLLHPRNDAPPLALRSAATTLLAPGGGSIALRLVMPYEYDLLMARLMAQPVGWKWPPPPWPAKPSPPPPPLAPAALPEGLGPLLAALARVLSDAEEGLRYGSGGIYRVHSSSVTAAVAAKIPPRQDGPAGDGSGGGGGRDGLGPMCGKRSEPGRQQPLGTASGESAADIEGWAEPGGRLSVSGLMPLYGAAAEELGGEPDLDPDWRPNGGGGGGGTSDIHSPVPVGTAFGLMHLAAELLRCCAPPPGAAPSSPPQPSPATPATVQPPPPPPSPPPPSSPLDGLADPAGALLDSSSRLLARLAPPGMSYAFALAEVYGTLGQAPAHPVVLSAMARGAELGAAETLALLDSLELWQPPPPPSPSPAVPPAAGLLEAAAAAGAAAAGHGPPCAATAVRLQACEGLRGCAAEAESPQDSHVAQQPLQQQQQQQQRPGPDPWVRCEGWTAPGGQAAATPPPPQPALPVETLTPGRQQRRTRAGLEAAAGPEAATAEAGAAPPPWPSPPQCPSQSPFSPPPPPPLSPPPPSWSPSVDGNRLLGQGWPLAGNVRQLELHLSSLAEQQGEARSREVVGEAEYDRLAEELAAMQGRRAELEEQQRRRPPPPLVPSPSLLPAALSHDADAASNGKPLAGPGLGGPALELEGDLAAALHAEDELGRRLQLQARVLAEAREAARRLSRAAGQARRQLLRASDCLLRAASSRLDRLGVPELQLSERQQQLAAVAEVLAEHWYTTVEGGEGDVGCGLVARLEQLVGHPMLAAPAPPSSPATTAAVTAAGHLGCRSAVDGVGGAGQGLLDLRLACATAWLASIPLATERLRAGVSGSGGGLEYGGGGADGEECRGGPEGRGFTDGGVGAAGGHPALVAAPLAAAAEPTRLHRDLRGRVLALVEVAEAGIRARLEGRAAEPRATATDDAAEAAVAATRLTAAEAAATREPIEAAGVSTAATVGAGPGASGCAAGVLSLRSAYALTAACWNVGVMPPVLRSAIAADIRAAAAAAAAIPRAAPAAARRAGGDGPADILYGTRGTGRGALDTVVQKLFIRRVLGADLQQPPSASSAAGASGIGGTASAALARVPYEGQLLMVMQLLDMGVISPLDGVEMLREALAGVLPLLRDPTRLAQLVRLMVGPDAAGGGSGGGGAAGTDPEVIGMSYGSSYGSALVSSLAEAAAPALPTRRSPTAVPEAGGAGTRPAELAAPPPRAAATPGGAAAPPDAAAAAASAAAARARVRVEVVVRALPALAANPGAPLEVLRVICAGVYGNQMTLSGAALAALTARLRSELAPVEAVGGAAGGPRDPRVTAVTLADLAAASHDAEQETRLDQVALVWVQQTLRRQQLLQARLREQLLASWAGDGGGRLDGGGGGADGGGGDGGGQLDGGDARSGFLGSRAAADGGGGVGAASLDAWAADGGDAEQVAEVAEVAVRLVGRAATRVPSPLTGHRGELLVGAVEAALGAGLSQADHERVVGQLLRLLPPAPPAPSQLPDDGPGPSPPPPPPPLHPPPLTVARLLVAVLGRPQAHAVQSRWAPAVEGLLACLGDQADQAARELVSEHLCGRASAGFQAGPVLDRHVGPPLPASGGGGGSRSSTDAAAVAVGGDGMPSAPPPPPPPPPSSVLSALLRAPFVQALGSAGGLSSPPPHPRPMAASAAGGPRVLGPAAAGAPAAAADASFGGGEDGAPPLLSPYGACLVRHSSGALQRLLSAVLLEAAAASPGGAAVSSGPSQQSPPWGSAAGAVVGGGSGGPDLGVPGVGGATAAPAAPPILMPGAAAPLDVQPRLRLITDTVRAAAELRRAEAAHAAEDPRAVGPVAAVADADAADAEGPDATTTTTTTTTSSAVRAAASHGGDDGPEPSAAPGMEVANRHRHRPEPPPPPSQQQRCLHRWSTSPLTPGLAAAQAFISRHWSHAPLEPLLRYGRDVRQLGGDVPRVVQLLQCAALLPALREAQEGLEHLQASLRRLRDQAAAAEERQAQARQQLLRAQQQGTQQQGTQQQGTQLQHRLTHAAAPPPPPPQQPQQTAPPAQEKPQQPQHHQHQLKEKMAMAEAAVAAVRERERALGASWRLQWRRLLGAMRQAVVQLEMLPVMPSPAAAASGGPITAAAESATAPPPLRSYYHTPPPPTEPEAAAGQAWTARASWARGASVELPTDPAWLRLLQAPVEVLRLASSAMSAFEATRLAISRRAMELRLGADSRGAGAAAAVRPPGLDGGGISGGDGGRGGVAVDDLVVSAELLSSERDALVAAQRRLLPYLADELAATLEAAAAAAPAVVPGSPGRLSSGATAGSAGDAFAAIAAVCSALARLLSLHPTPAPPSVRTRATTTAIDAGGAAMDPAISDADAGGGGGGVEMAYSAPRRFRLALRGCELVARLGHMHDGLAEIAMRQAGEAFREAAAAETATGGGGGGAAARHGAVAAALVRVALPALRLYGKAGGVSVGSSGYGAGAGDGRAALMYDHPLVPLLTALEQKAEGILGLTLPTPRRQPPLTPPPPRYGGTAAPLTSPPPRHGGTAVPLACTAVSLPVELFLALLGAGYVRGRLPYALANVIIDLLDDRPRPSAADRDPWVGAAATAGRLSDAQLEALLMAAPAVMLVDRGATSVLRWVGAGGGGGGGGAAAGVPPTPGLTLGYRLLTEVAELLTKSWASTVWHQQRQGQPSPPAGGGALAGAAASSAGTPGGDGGGGVAAPAAADATVTAATGGVGPRVSRLALCCLAHALSRRNRDGVFLQYTTWLYGQLYGELVAQARTEAQAPAGGGDAPGAAVAGSSRAVAGDAGELPSWPAEGNLGGGAGCDGAEERQTVVSALELLRLAASGRNRGDAALESLSTRRLWALLRRAAAQGDPRRCAALISAVDDVVWEGEVLFGLGSAPPPPSPQPCSDKAWPLPVRQVRRRAAANAAARPVLFGVGFAPAQDVVEVLVEADGSSSDGGGDAGGGLAEVVSELVLLAAPELPGPRLARVLSWASTGPAASAPKVVTRAIHMEGPAGATVTHGSVRGRLAAVWHDVVDRWLHDGDGAAGADGGGGGGGGSCESPPPGSGAAAQDSQARGGAGFRAAYDTSGRRAGLMEPAALDARAATALMASGERLGCADPRATQALSRVLEAALLWTEGGEGVAGVEDEDTLMG